MRRGRLVSLGVALALVLVPARSRAQRSDNPHGALTETCAACHGPEGWKPVRISSGFRHAEQTFALDGAHRRTSCMSCHTSLDFKQTPTGCASCHGDVHHGEVGTQCARCHTTRSFVDVERMRRVHEMTRFPLRGAHATAQCSSCHTPSRPGQSEYSNLPTTCVACHVDSYRLAKAPDHQAAHYSLDCASCHSVSSWSGATFDHATTQFPLTGAHRTAACTSCHGDGVFHGKSTACLSCHQLSLAAATSPPHAALGFSTVCTACHTTTAWQPASFDHSTTPFPLTGAHRAASCADCHADKVYKGKPTECASCHQATYNATSNPPHATAGFPTTCATCHTTTTWTGATFNHSTTRFPLTGAHLTQPCSACHGDGVYRGKPFICSGCHLAAYNGTTNPVHTAAHFPTTCESCHNTTTWLGATFDHDGSFFPIYSGRHKGRWTICADCHTSPTNYAVFTCTSCHSKSATDPNHRSVSGYSYDSNRCYSCHPKGNAG